MLIHGKTSAHRRSASADWRGLQVEQAHKLADLHADLPRREDAPGTARALATAWCDTLELAPTHCDTVRLLVSEVVTNAVLHSEAPSGAIVRLAASLSDGSVTVTVADAGTGSAPLARVPDPLNGGYGLFLLESEATQWGVDRGSEGTRVWFRLELSPEAEGSDLPVGPG
jgi:anti-sigma regulatory factor (Ser/Thr protein kinase)